jgi:hypothetical protein
MKEHYQPSSSINLISSGWKERAREREKEQKKIFHWFITVKDLRKRNNLLFFFFFFGFQRISFFNFSLARSCDMSESGGMAHTHIRERRKKRRKRDLLLVH